MKRVLICLLAFLPLSGCEVLPFARELEDTMLVQVLGVDWTQDGVTLTAACDPGAGSENSKTAVLSAWGGDPDEAQAALRGTGDEYVSLTHAAQLVVGAGTDLAAVLETALAEPALGQGATVWLARGDTAQHLLEAVGGGAKRLSSIELNTGVAPVTVLRALMRLEEDGEVELPCLALEGETLVPAGTAVVRKEDAGGA